MPAFRAILPAAALLLTAACAQFQTAASPKDSSAAQAPAKAAPAAASAQEDPQLASLLKSVKKNLRADYKISPADLLDINVFREKDLTQTVRVSQAGTISLPLVGVLQVAGLSLTEAQAALAEKLQDYLVEPQVTIFIKEYGNKTIFVLGEVKTPGAVELPAESKLTVLEAISLAGGFTPVAAKDKTTVIRETADGKSTSFKIAISEITKGDKSKDMSLAPNDVVYIPQSLF